MDRGEDKQNQAGTDHAPGPARNGHASPEPQYKLLPAGESPKLLPPPPGSQPEPKQTPPPKGPPPSDKPRRHTLIWMVLAVLLLMGAGLWFLRGAHKNGKGGAAAK